MGGHRLENNCIVGVNLMVLDVDGGVTIDTVKLLLKDYKHLIYTTKSHTEQSHRFRVILPLSHTLKLSADDYKEFCNNVYEWLPFEVDNGTNQRSRKWRTYDSDHWYNDGKPLDALLFIPKTSKSEERKKIIVDQQSLSNLERWFVANTGSGNRNNQYLKYALVLVDSGMDIDSIQNNVLALNDKLPNKIDEAEILSTIMRSTAKAIIKRDSN